MIILKQNLKEKLQDFTLKDLEPIVSIYKEFYTSFIDKKGFVDKDFLSKVIEDFNSFASASSKRKFTFFESNTKNLKSKSKDIEIANKLNPVKITIGVAIGYTTSYIIDEEIYLTITKEEILYLIDCANNGENVFSKRNTYVENLKECEHFVSHEISHWIDFTTNKFVKPKFNNIKKIAKINNVAFELLISNPRAVEFASYFEINAQIHTIKTLKEKYLKEWDTFSMYDVIHKNIGLETAFKVLSFYSTQYANNWLKHLLKRMCREGLLGEKMSGTKSMYLEQYIERYLDENVQFGPDVLLRELGKQEVLSL